MALSGGYAGGINRAAIPTKPSKAAGRPRMRACLLCSFVQPSTDWVQAGCPNCENVLECSGSQERVKQCTSLQFDGVIAMLMPDKSWVAKYQRMGPMQPGLYATIVFGRPPKYVLDRLKDQGVPYIPRDDPSGDPVEQEDSEEEEDEGDEDDLEAEELAADRDFVADDDEELGLEGLRYAGAQKPLRGDSESEDEGAPRRRRQDEDDDEE